MKRLLFKLYLRQQEKLSELKNKQKCNDCGTIAVPTRRLSVFNLIIWIILGIGVGLLINFVFHSPGYAWMLGFITTALATYINVKQLKPQCRKCYSFDIHLLTEEDIKS